MEKEFIPVDPVEDAKKHIAQLLHMMTPEHPVEKIIPLLMPPKEKGVDFQIPIPALRGRLGLKSDPMEVVNKWAQVAMPNEWIDSLQVIEGKMSFINVTMNKVGFNKFVLQTIHQAGLKYGNNLSWAGKTVAVEYSSPNIAKPFHCGHLRSTIIGNVLKHLYRAMGANVIGINYLGDWGKQYGLLAVAWNKYGSEEELKNGPVKHLVDIYVKINQDKESDPTVDTKAREYFRKMESGDEEALALWKKFKDFSVEELCSIYKRLNVDFDVWDGESMQQQGMDEAYEQLKSLNLLEDSNGAEIVNLEKWKLGVSIIKKSDGATLYITRDIAAAISRYNKYKFDKLIYVVSAQQNLHFKQLFKMLELMGHKWAKDCTHINYGMVSLPSGSMSTRSGNVLLLDDVVTAAQESMYAKMLEDVKGKLSEIQNERGEDPKEVADLIGLSACVIQDLSAKRIKDYVFIMDRATSHTGYTGPYLQYTHARLCSMKDRNCDVKLHDDVDFSLLSEETAHQLVQQLSFYPRVIDMSAQNLEPCTLVSYLFDLASAVNAANKFLWIKNQEPAVAEARMLLYNCARLVMNSGLTMLGLIPLERM